MSEGRKGRGQDREKREKDRRCHDVSIYQHEDVTTNMYEAVSPQVDSKKRGIDYTRCTKQSWEPSDTSPNNDAQLIQPLHIYIHCTRISTTGWVEIFKPVQSTTKQSAPSLFPSPPPQYQEKVEAELRFGLRGVWHSAAVEGEMQTRTLGVEISSHPPSLSPSFLFFRKHLEKCAGVVRRPHLPEKANRSKGKKASHQPLIRTLICIHIHICLPSLPRHFFLPRRRHFPLLDRSLLQPEGFFLTIFILPPPNVAKGPWHPIALPPAHDSSIGNEGNRQKGKKKKTNKSFLACR
ncbi:hypothetical protein L249_8387 [Ophiocordyceps polyrhachis-furcata BCC 54312]|uniref:Uncharacterized protein n=1 Tax=Ophiocordyceps polyrhachis-furcata BCC 54312 TaxID=1330021 RepID=A0A367L6T9_9HYPO|nr:hypothetical protein L249_8387 [Ophiocordyceps polyrhachis-furcata BCC 54312]